MRIAIDTNPLYTTQAGMARYVRSLLAALRTFESKNLQFLEVGWPVENFQYRQPIRTLKTVYRELVWARWVAPKLIARSGATVYHITGTPLTSARSQTAQVATVHDLAVFRNPERFRQWHRLSARNNAKKLLGIERIICISKFTAKELKEVMQVPAEKISVIYYGCPFHPEEAKPVEKRPAFEMPAEYLLFVSSLEPGKNIRLIRETYELAERQGIKLPPLLLAGSRWKGVSHEGPPPRGWRFLGHQSDESLVYLYRHALALLFPSKYEGFGLPVVESQALGCPVICSRVASLPEVGGIAALYVDMNAGAYLEGILRLKSEPGLREDLVGKGRIHSSQFSWRRCARETIEVYRQVAKVNL